MNACCLPVSRIELTVAALAGVRFVVFLTVALTVINVPSSQTANMSSPRTAYGTRYH